MSKIPTCLTKRHFQNNVVYFRTTVDCVVNGTATTYTPVAIWSPYSFGNDYNQNKICMSANA